MRSFTRKTTKNKMRNVGHFVKLSFGFADEEMLHLLTYEHQIIINIRTLKRSWK